MSELQLGSEFAQKLANKEYDFIDFGCSKGGSLRYAQRHLGGTRGVGIDLSPGKVELTRKNGGEAYVANAMELALYPDAVRFVTMIDFLEHVPSVLDAEKCIRSACSVASEFVFIRQPWFDSDGYLLSRGLKLYWSDWHGHPNAMTSLEFYRVVSRIPRVKRWRIYGKRLITSSSDSAIHPLHAPRDQPSWDANSHPEKPAIVFDQPVYQQIGCVALIKDDLAIFETIERNTQWDAVLLDGPRVT